jgi:GAF domain-containing protein
VTSEAAREILVRGARAIAHSNPGQGLDNLLAVIAEQVDVESAVIVVVDAPERLSIVAWTGLAEPAIAGLAEALRNPAHPIARTIGDSGPSFDVLPTAPGGPALRSHLPLAVARGGSETVLGVLALAHHRPLDAESRELLQAAADLAALAIER